MTNPTPQRGFLPLVVTASNFHSLTQLVSL